MSPNGDSIKKCKWKYFKNVYINLINDKLQQFNKLPEFDGPWVDPTLKFELSFWIPFKTKKV